MYPWLRSKLEASLGYMRSLSQKPNRTNKQETRRSFASYLLGDLR